MKKGPLTYDSMEAAIGNTPMIKLNKLPKEHGIAATFYVKCDYLNPGGSSKDRICSYMIDAAEKSGKLKPGDTIVESTSGNTGIGLALSAAVRGYKLIITIPDKMSMEKINTLKALGAEVIVTPTAVGHDHPDNYVSVARRIGSQPNHFHVNQYANEANVLAHYNTTANEIWEQMDKKVNYVFISVGTGGTITGVARRFQELDPSVKLIGVDPEGSILALPETLNTVRKTYKIEGIGQDQVPHILNRGLVSEWVKINDCESFNMARDMILKEGVLAGGSCGSTLIGAFKYLKAKGLEKEEGLRCVVFLPDSIRNYMTKFLVDEWMIGNNFRPVPRELDPKDYFAGKSIKDYPAIFKKLPYFDKRLTISDCMDLFKTGLPLLPIRQDSEIVGIVTKQKLINAITVQNLNRASSCSNCLDQNFLRMPSDAPLWLVQRCLSNNYHLILLGAEKDEIYCPSQSDIIQILDADLKELI